MPELPEVEMVVRHLRRLVIGRTLERVRLLRPRLAPELTPRQFAAKLRGSSILDVTRRGKHILTHLSNRRIWITHLRMSGRFLYFEPGQEGSEDIPFTHAHFDLDDGRRLLFVDQRHFGYMAVVDADGPDNIESLRKLAPEPFDPAFSGEYFLRVCGRSRQAIKLLLLDQTRVSGLGNIYAAESLHRAGIDPSTPANAMTRECATLLHARIIEVLREAIEAGSTLETDPREVYGHYGSGAWEENWRVYGREGEPCLTCGETILRFTQGGRSTYHCPRCQR